MTKRIELAIDRRRELITEKNFPLDRRRESTTQKIELPRDRCS